MSQIEIGEIKRDFAEQIDNLNLTISSMGITIVKLKNIMKEKWKDLFDAVLEKDIMIQELEEVNEDLENKIGKQEINNARLVDIWEYNQVLTMNTAMKSNVKFLTNQVLKVEKENKDLVVKSNSNSLL